MAVDTIYLKNEQGVDVPYQLGADSRNVTYSPNAETVEGSVHKELQQNNIHKNTIIANNAGVHGLRYTDNKLQVQAPGGGWTPIDFGTGDMKKADYDEPGQDGVIGTEHGGTGNTSGYVRVGAQIGSPIGNGATAEGGDTIASGIASHAEGIESQATGAGSHAEGGSIEEYQGATYIGNGGAATGLGSHAEGFDTTASGDQSHAEGIKSQATGIGSHAEGGYYISNTSNPRDRVQYSGGIATGHSSHAEGAGTIARGIASHAEGMHTNAIGQYCHTEGNNTIIPSGVSGSHAGGHSIELSGDYSFAFGDGDPITGMYTEVKTNSSFTMVHAPRQKFGANLDGYIFGVSMKPDSLEYDDGSEFPPLDGRMGACITLEPDQAMNYGKKCRLAPGGMYLLMIGAEDTQNIQHSTQSIFVSSTGTIIMNPINYTDVETALVSVDVSTNTCISFTMTQSPSSAKAVCQLIRLA